MKKQSTLEFLGGIALGAAIGYVAGILSAPKAGRDLRHEIQTKGSDLCQNVKSSTEKGKDVLVHRVEVIECNIATKMQDLKGACASLSEKLDARLHHLVDEVHLPGRRQQADVEEGKSVDKPARRNPLNSSSMISS